MEAGNVRLANDLKIRVQGESAFVSSLDTTLPWTIFLNEVYISQFCLINFLIENLSLRL